MDIDMRALKQLELDDAIPFSELVQIIEAAVLVAYHKHVGLQPKRDEPERFRASLDQKTGQVTIWGKEVDEEGNLSSEETEVTPEGFGRIAAYSARQVIATRLRALTDENLLGEFTGKVGDIVMGTIQQGSKPHMIAVSLGSIEGALPAEEQVPGEDYSHGKRIRVLIVNVSKGSRGGPIVTLSRRHPNLVRKLFSLEVPEIASGAVEIMQVAREAGHRTKIAVRANQPGVNAKGSCIGPLGQRVRAVSAELNEEKIDIVDWSADLPAFVAQALSPAKVTSAYLIPSDDPKLPHVRALVPDYQFSLAIGKEGQNVRLAAHLTGAKIDIQPESILDE
jgi:N utilization substance protein A